MKRKRSVIQKSEEILGGIPVFAGTRVPVQTLLEYLEAGERVTDFLEDFPTVKYEQAISVLKYARKTLLDANPH